MALTGHCGMIAEDRDRVEKRLNLGGTIYFEGGPDDLFGRIGADWRLRRVAKWIPVVAIRSKTHVHFFRLSRRHSPGGAVYLLYVWSGARYIDDLDD